jgi:hypothetical protein
LIQWNYHWIKPQRSKRKTLLGPAATPCRLLTFGPSPAELRRARPQKEIKESGFIAGVERAEPLGQPPSLANFEFFIKKSCMKTKKLQGRDKN